MKVMNSPLPCSVSFESGTGVVSQATAHYQKRLSDLRGLFLDAGCPGTAHSKGRRPDLL